MRRAYLLSIALLIFASVVFPPSLFAQCQSRVLVSPASNGPFESQYAVSIATLDHRCLTGGSYTVHAMPPGAVIFENGIDSFFDVFLEVSTDHYVRRIELTPQLPPGIVFQMLTNVVYNDPWYPPETIVEDCWVNPATGMFEFFVPLPPPEYVPPSMSMGQAECFMVVHKVYRVPLIVPGPGIRPLVSITPGCNSQDICTDDPACIAGGENDYRADVIIVDGQWVLEFEYSNASIQPVCYCVNYSGCVSEHWEFIPLLGFDEHDQTIAVSASVNGDPACGTMELFSYPPGAVIDPFPWSNEFYLTGPFQRLGEVAVSRGTFLPGQEFYLGAYFEHSGVGMCVDDGGDWAYERVRVLPDGTLRVEDFGGECPTAEVYVPLTMSLGQAECITVCHDVYYIQLETPPNQFPVITANPGCLPPCVPTGCNPGGPYDYMYWVERIGTHWYLRFEYSNPNIEPVCYCVNFEQTVPIPLQSNQLCAFDDLSQSLRVSLWGSSPLEPLSGSYQIAEQPLRSDPPWSRVQSFFDIFMEPLTWDIPIPPFGHPPGEPFQLVTTFTFDQLGVVQSEYREWVVMNGNGTISPIDPPDSPCQGLVPPQMSLGESQCFIVCHDIYEIPLIGPPGRPIIDIVPGCEPPCVPPVPCIPGAPSDYMTWLTFDGLNWTLHFEYSNQFIEPACYCVTYTGTETVFEPHVLACWDEGSQELDVSVAVINPSGLPANASGIINIYTIPPGAAVVLPYPNTFSGVNETWHHIAARFDIPPIEPESFFDIWCEVQFISPEIPTQFYREPVHAIATPPDVWVENVDEGGECTGTNIPPYGLYPGQSWCFIVCHDVYHIPIYMSDRPTIEVTPGCMGPPQDECETWECIPGGIWDYRYDIYWDPIGMHWILEFEYSNQWIEPVCYCVHVQAPPCNPAAELTILYSEDQLGFPAVQLNWLAPQAAIYNIYSTLLPNYTTLPPSLEWILEASIPVAAAGPQSWTMSLGEAGYKNYLILVDCPIGTRR